MGVPNIFANATTQIPLVQLDQNFNTTLQIGNTSVGLGNVSSSFTPNSTVGVIGTTTNDNVAAGSWGEYQSAIVTQGNAVAATSLTNTTITTLPLTAGDWDVVGIVGSVVANSARTLTEQVGWVNTSAAQPAVPGDGGIASIDGVSSNNGFTVGIPAKRFSLNANATIYLVGVIAYNGSTGNSLFGAIRARRIR